MMLSEEKCVPCRAGGAPLPAEEARELARSAEQWTLSEKRIEREIKFKDFRAAMAFVNQVADLANEQDHHPDICISYNRVRLTLMTHKVGGLTRNDFIMAARIDRIAAQPKETT
jgi:4a-hydroxytetrahydrobiopterin dehydratase